MVTEQLWTIDDSHTPTPKMEPSISVGRWSWRLELPIRCCVGSLSKNLRRKSPKCRVYNYPSLSKAFLTPFVLIFYSHLNLPCLIFPFSYVEPLKSNLSLWNNFLKFLIKYVCLFFLSNRLLGKLPSRIWFLRGLHALDSLVNLLDGVVPVGIEALYDLKGMNLSTNRFPEQLPRDIGGCFLLKLVDFTHFSENLFTGSIPESM